MLKTSKRYKGYVVKYNNKYLHASHGGMGSYGFAFVTLNKATIFSSVDAKYYAKTLPVLDEKNNNVVVPPQIIKVERQVQSTISTSLKKK